MTQLQLHTKAISGSAFATRGLDSEKEQRPGDAASDGRFRYEAERTREQSRKREREREKWIGTVADEGEPTERTRESGCSLVSPAIILFN